MKSSRRLFFALWPDDQTRDALCEWQRQFVPQGARKTHHDDLHLTLHFLGQVPVEHLDNLIVLGASQHADPFDLQLDRLGHFSRARVLWAGFNSISAPLGNLHEDLGEGVRDLGLSPEHRPYKPHVTLARKVSEAPQVAEITPIKWRVRQWGLFESVPGRFPLYEPMALWKIPEK